MWINRGSTNPGLSLIPVVALLILPEFWVISRVIVFVFVVMRKVQNYGKKNQIKLGYRCRCYWYYQMVSYTN